MKTQLFYLLQTANFTITFFTCDFYLVMYLLWCLMNFSIVSIIIVQSVYVS